MTITDPIADMLTRIRNALLAKHETVLIPLSIMKKSIAEILLKEGYISGIEEVGEGIQTYIKLTLKYGQKNRPAITGIKRISKPGLRIYSGYDKLPKVLNGMGIAVVSTSKGIITDKQARAEKIGGEVLAFVW
ncbi:MAG: 30S ribosomal protein S8 [Clostridiales bacterium]|jgi:small subunit ribosomal protein S8|nr:30S ribosomal protein S8 [Clostridiales bacterium]